MPGEISTFNNEAEGPYVSDEEFARILKQYSRLLERQIEDKVAESDQTLRLRWLEFALKQGYKRDAAS